jgi:membrane dipeptidase
MKNEGMKERLHDFTTAPRHDYIRGRVKAIDYKTILTNWINLMKIIFFSAILLILSTAYQPMQKETLVQKAARIHNAVLTIDTHCDTPMNLVGSDFNVAERHDAKESGTKVDLPRMKEGGLDAQFWAVFLSQGKRTEEGHANANKKAFEIIKAIYKSVEASPELAQIAKTPEDAYTIAKTGKRAIYIGIENGYAIAHDLSMIGKFWQLGARYITLCHTLNNDICDSSTDKKGAEYNGLSPFGVEVVKEMNRIGMMIDVSHISDSSLYDVLKITKDPVIASHSCSRAICDNPRNLTDDGLRAIANNGGVIQMCILTDYVKTPDPNPARDSARTVLRIKYNNFEGLTDEQEKAGWNEWREISKKFPQNLASVKDVVDHIDHIVKVAGIDHVGIGTDFDGGGAVSGCFDVSEMGNITLELVKRGYTEEQIRKIWGGNFMRVFKAVLNGAAKI